MSSDLFRLIARKTSDVVGSSNAFAVALLVVFIWLLSGHYFNYSDTWQLVINTGTTIVTFLMVFLIQNSQNRDAKVFHIKLNELLRGVRGARTELVDLEELTDTEIETLHTEFKTLHEKLAKEKLERKLRTRSKCLSVIGSDIKSQKQNSD